MRLTLGLTGLRERFEGRIFSLAREGATVFTSMTDLPALIDPDPALFLPRSE